LCGGREIARKSGLTLCSICGVRAASAKEDYLQLQAIKKHRMHAQAALGKRETLN
jgi:hypothetical protein